MNDLLPARAAFWSVCIIAIGAILFGTIRPSRQRLAIYSQLSEFVLTNQNRQPVTLAALRGQIWVADIIYTRCPSQCIKMTYQMGQLQAAFPGDSGVKLVSITTDPAYDTPGILKNYGLRNGARDNWLFLTGDKGTICSLVVEGMKLAIEEKTPGAKEDPSDFFVHSSKFVLIDKLGRVRGYYSGDTSAAQPQLVADIKFLAKE